MVLRFGRCDDASADLRSDTCKRWTVAVFVSQLEDCSLQLAPNGNYLDLDSTLLEQKDELENFYQDVM